MTDDLIFENVRDPSITPPKPHRSGLPVLSDKRPPLPVAMQPGEPGFVDTLMGVRVVVRGHPGTARSMMQKGPRGVEVYVRLDQGSGAWFPLAEVDPADETPVAPCTVEWAAGVDVARDADATGVVWVAAQQTPFSETVTPPTMAQIAKSSQWLDEMDFS